MLRHFRDVRARADFGTPHFGAVEAPGCIERSASTRHVGGTNFLPTPRREAQLRHAVVPFPTLVPTRVRASWCADLPQGVFAAAFLRWFSWGVRGSSFARIGRAVYRYTKFRMCGIDGVRAEVVVANRQRRPMLLSGRRAPQLQAVSSGVRLETVDRGKQGGLELQAYLHGDAAQIGIYLKTFGLAATQRTCSLGRPSSGPARSCWPNLVKKANLANFGPSSADSACYLPFAGFGPKLVNHFWSKLVGVHPISIGPAIVRPFCPNSAGVRTSSAEAGSTH